MPLPIIVAGAEIGPEPVVHQMAQEKAILPLFYDHYLIGMLPSTPALRAQAGAYFAPRGAVLSLRTAAWVYLGGLPPKYVSVIMEPGTSPVGRKWDVRAVRTTISARSVHFVDGVAVTSPEQTVADLARLERAEIAVPVIQELKDYGVDLRTSIRMVPDAQRNGHHARDLIQALAK